MNKNKINLGQYDLKSLLEGAQTITKGTSVVLEVVKKMPREYIEDAIKLGKSVERLTAANQKLCEVINEIIDKDKNVDDLPDNLFCQSLN